MKLGAMSAFVLMV